MSDIFDALSSPGERQPPPAQPIPLNDEQFAFLDEEPAAGGSNFSMAGLEEFNLGDKSGIRTVQVRNGDLPPEQGVAGALADRPRLTEVPGAERIPRSHFGGGLAHATAAGRLAARLDIPE